MDERIRPLEQAVKRLNKEDVWELVAPAFTNLTLKDDFKQQVFNPMKGAAGVEMLVIGKTNVLFAPYEYFSRYYRKFSSPISGACLEQLVEAKQTRLVVAEYFYPNLRRNFDRLGKNERLKRGKDDFRYFRRLDWSEVFAKQLHKARKNVAMIDIADGPEFMFHERVGQTIPGVLNLMVISIELFRRNMVEIGVALPLLSLLTLVMSSYYIEKFKGDHNFPSVFDNYPSRWEGLLFNWETARRLFYARGVRLLSEHFDNRLEEEKWLLVPLPSAHQTRIVEGLINPKKIEPVAAQVYQMMGSGIDFSAEIWKPRGPSRLALRQNAWEVIWRKSMV